MSNFFVDTEMYNYRLDICRACNFYFKPTGSCKRCGCFMKIKASIAMMKCPVDKWLQEIAPKIKGGKAKDNETKQKLVTLHNTIYGTRYKVTTSCSTCLNDCYKGITRLIK